jgi:hypothetical protein
MDPRLRGDDNLVCRLSGAHHRLLIARACEIVRGFLRRPVAVRAAPGKAEGGEAPRGAGAERRTSWPALRSGRSPKRRGPPAHDAGRRAFRRFTAAFWCGAEAAARTSGRACEPDRSGRSAGSLHTGHSARRAGPRGLPGSPADEAGPAGAAPHSANRHHRLTPSNEWGDRNIF